MDPAHRVRLKDVFATALALPPSARGGFLDEACSGDLALQREVESLLAASDHASDFLEQPVHFDGLAALGVAPAFLTPPLAANRRLGPYEILGPLGAGGMGEVYRARDVRLDRIVALKVLPPAAAASAEARKRFEQEARAISKLNNPNICALYDLGHQDGIDFLVMEYLEGQTLAALIEAGPLPNELLVRTAIEIADALDVAHRHGVIHLDLKPSNIIVTASGAKLLDFGVAKLHDRAPDADTGIAAEVSAVLTHRGRRIGTAAYMSPEQVRGEGVDARSDLFSFGAVLYEMTTRRRPFSGANADAIYDAILRGAPPVDESAPAIPRGLADVIGKALEGDRARRYQRASEIGADLRRIEQTLKHPASGAWWSPLKVAAAALAAVVVALVVFVARSDHTAPVVSTAVPSIAVLPFKPMALDAASADETYIGVALADALITELGAFKTVTTRPLSASSRYGADRDPLAAGRDLRAELVVDGAIQRAGDTLRVSVSLLRVADGASVWSDRFDTRWTDVFRVLDTIAEHVGGALSVTLPGEDRERMHRRRTRNAAAYEAYLKGRYFWNTRTAAGFQKALDYFHQAIEHDDRFAAAYAGLADTYALLGSMPYAAMPSYDAAAKAKAAAQKALEIDDTQPEAQTSLAFVTYVFDWDWAAGERLFKRAIELDPSYAPARYWYSLYLGQVGRVDEALIQATRARDLEPLSLIGNYSVALAHYFARRYDAVEDDARKALEIEPNFAQIRRLLGQVYAATGRHRDALTEFEQLTRPAPANWLHKGQLANAYGRVGDRTRALAILREMEANAQTQFVPAAPIAIGYIGLGDRDAAFMWLEKAYAERSQTLSFLKMDPMFDPLRPDPRFARLLERVGLQP